MTVRRLILGFAAVAPLLAIAVAFRSIPAAIGVIFVSHMLILYPTLRAGSQWLGPVVTSFRPSGKEVWLTIDDGPDPSTSPAILDLLDAHGAKATFFVKGNKVRAAMRVAVEILRRGHSIGNHSDTHPSGTFWSLPGTRIAAEIDGCNRAIEEVAGAPPTLFRAPVGMKNPFVHPLLRARGMTLIGWSARGFDGVRTDPRSVLAGIEKDLAPGAIVLLHEGRSGNVETIRKLLDVLAGHGYVCVVPDQSRFLYGRRNVSR